MNDRKVLIGAVALAMAAICLVGKVLLMRRDAAVQSAGAPLAGEMSSALQKAPDQPAAIGVQPPEAKPVNWPDRTTEATKPEPDSRTAGMPRPGNLQRNHALPNGVAGTAPEVVHPQPEPARSPQGAEQTVPARPVTESEAREALRAVGTDPGAEAVWMAAINDPNLGAEQRKNLIEDLNEDGFADPKNITAADLPLIVNRLELIEDLAPSAIDQANADAFAEAYKDLENMAKKVSRK